MKITVEIPFWQIEEEIEHVLGSAHDSTDTEIALIRKKVNDTVNKDDVIISKVYDKIYEAIQSVVI